MQNGRSSGVRIPMSSRSPSGHNPPVIPPPIVILGPTASGKTRLAVALAGKINGAIISADSRQVYRGLDIGTGKDLEEYGDIPYYLIDLMEAGTRFHISRYLSQVQAALGEIRQQGRTPIICGGTGLYIQALMQGVDFSEVPVNEALRQTLLPLSIQELRQILDNTPKPAGFHPDTSTAKRLVRAIEICHWIAENPDYTPRQALCPDAKVFGIAPRRETRRQHITARLQQRLQEGLVDEVKSLLNNGLTAEQLIYYGLEYKYTTLYLEGILDYSGFVNKLETEIHRFAKRQMTYFRKMEKDGIHIHWLQGNDHTERLEEIFTTGIA